MPQRINIRETFGRPKHSSLQRRVVIGFISIIILGAGIGGWYAAQRFFASGRNQRSESTASKPLRVPTIEDSRIPAVASISRPPSHATRDADESTALPHSEPVHSEPALSETPPDKAITPSPEVSVAVKKNIPSSVSENSNSTESVIHDLNPSRITEKQGDELGLKIEAIAWAEDSARRIAVINGRIVREGDVVKGIYIHKIGLSDIIFRKERNLWKIVFRID